MSAYGFAGHKIGSLAPVPLAHEANVIARCQSARSIHGYAAKPWSYAVSVAWLRNAERLKPQQREAKQPRLANFCRPVLAMRSTRILPEPLQDSAGRQSNHDTPKEPK